MSEFHKDMVKEGIGIAVAHAATSLSQLFNGAVDMDVPKIEIIDKEEFISHISKLDEGIVVCFDILEGMKGKAILHFPIESALTLSAILMGMSPENMTELDELGESAIMEVGNIMISTYTDILSILLKESVSLSPPNYNKNKEEIMCCINMPRFQKVNKVFLFKTSIYSEEYNIETSFYIIPPLDSIEKLIKSLEGELNSLDEH
ncbi:chemotaxis protein CheC [Palaeococcus pacificus]|nr:chemotaxis protein CheC [Palaeococcus pacificus]